MIVLGFDTATPATAVALRLADGTSSQARDDPPAGAHPGHATRLLGMASELLEAAGVRWSEIDRIAVGVGPGTFTGLRVGVATARGLAQALGAELVGVSSLTALAAGAVAAGVEEPLLAVIDARRGEVFAAAYLPDAPLPRELCEPGALAPAELAARLAGERRWVAVGDGAVRYREQLTLPSVLVPPDDWPAHRISAEVTCSLGAIAPAARSLEQVTPDYQRRPDAEIALDGAVAGSKPQT